MVREIEWKPKQPLPAEIGNAFEGSVRAVRLFAYGDVRAREKVRAKIGKGWDDEYDWFVA